MLSIFLSFFARKYLIASSKFDIIAIKERVINMLKIGIDIGGSHIGVGLVNENGEIVAKREINLMQEDRTGSQEKMLQYIQKSIDKVLANKEIGIESVEMIGIASPGLIKKGMIVKADNLKLNRFNIVGELKKKYHVPIYLDNDAKCAAVAESVYGNLKGYVDSVFVCIGTGIGGAVFWDGHLLESARTPGFELGHMTIEKDGRLCSCGNRGCFEAYSSIGNLKKMVVEKLGITDELTGKQLLEVLSRNLENPVIEDLLEYYNQHLAIGLSNLINIFEPEIIVLGGSIVYYEDLIINPIREKLRKGNAIFNSDMIPKISLAKLKNDAGIVGATVIRSVLHKLT